MSRITACAARRRAAFAPHVALMGAIGKGNNMTGVQIALELASQARIPFLFIDPKGEFVADGRPIGPFAGLSNVGAMEAGTDPVPLDFHARSEHFDDATPTMVWIFYSVPSGLGRCLQRRAPIRVSARKPPRISGASSRS